MNPIKEIKKQQEKDLEKLLLEDMKRLFENYYRAELSERVKRGLAAKRKQNEINKRSTTKGN